MFGKDQKDAQKPPVFQDKSGEEDIEKPAKIHGLSGEIRKQIISMAAIATK
jgi:hypothetical protein